MFCAYASSKEKDRTRPVCTLLREYLSTTDFHSLTTLTVTFVKDIVPLDLQKPRIIKLTVESSLKRVNEYAEFDTEESAREWRKEIIGTAFLHLLNLVFEYFFKVPFSTIAIFAKKYTPPHPPIRKASV